NYAGELTSAAVTLTKQDLTGTVTITGTPQFSETLTASVTQLPADAQNITYKWYVNGVEVQGVNGNTWTPGKEVVGKAITVKVTADNYAGELTSAEVVLQIRDLTGSLTITGGQKPTEELTVDVKDLPADAQNVSYQWYANGTAIPGATSASWTIEEAYVGQSISVQLIADNYTGSLTSNEVVIQPTDKTPSVSISGNAVVGSTLQAVLQDVPANAQNISYQWYVDGVAIPGATSDSFVVEEAYAGKSITVKVSFDDLALEIESLKVEIANPENDNVAGDDNTTAGEVPNTGDSTNVFMLLLMAAGALLAKAGIVFKSSKEKE
ncbi:MAG: LPXTG cell wall anchor domain-containing protein, partial [Erysipelotrichaceae bacterium]|nr:LPXTG cell wall anchor domain-containing protein [Erysipelotrichaceae bacterium]